MGGAVPFENVSLGRLIGENIFRHGDMGRWSAPNVPDGWRVIEGRCLLEKANTPSGADSTCLDQPAKGSTSLQSKYFQVKSGRTYLVRWLLKQAGGPAEMKDSSNKVSSWLTIDWFTSKREKIGAYNTQSAYTTDWDYRTDFVKVPENAAFGRITFRLTNACRRGEYPGRVWLAEISLCPYRPPKTPDIRIEKIWSVMTGSYELKSKGHEGRFWIFPAHKRGTTSYVQLPAIGVAKEPDERAISGLALRWVGGKPPTIIYADPYMSYLPPGLYRVAVRVRITPARLKPSDDLVTWACVTLGGDSSTGRTIFIRERDFRGKDEYREFTMDVMKPDWRRFGLRIDSTKSSPDFRLDYISFTLLCPLTDTDAQFLYPGMFGKEEVRLEHGASRVLFIKGLMSEAWGLPGAFRACGLSDVDTVRYGLGYLGSIRMSGKTDFVNNLERYKLLVIANSNIRFLDASARWKLKQWIEAGGGLVMLGGKAAYGAGVGRRSFLADTLPVKVAEGPYDIERNAGLLSPQKHPVVRGIHWKEPVVAPYMHRIKVRPGGRVVISAGDRPFLVLGTFGRGKVACFCAAPYGESAEGKTHFTDWKYLPKLMANVLSWASNRAIEE